MNKDWSPDPVALYRAATDRAIVVVEAVRTDQLGSATPCSEWTVQQLLDHLADGTAYLLSAAAGKDLQAAQATGVEYRRRVEDVLKALALPVALERTCLSPWVLNGPSRRRWRGRSWTC